MKLGEIANLAPAELKQLAQNIGHTPMVSIHLSIKQKRRRVYLKLEGANPTGSMKDRTGYALMQDLEQKNILHPNAMIVESTSGNLGVALALQCRARGYGFTAVIDPKTTLENIQKMERLGANIEIVHQPDETGGYLLSRLEYIQTLCQRSSRYIWTDQYNNPANPNIHYSSTAPEIYSQMRKNVGIIFVPVSTGGTLGGVGRFFREVSPSTQIIGVDAYGSVVFGTPPARRKLTGIGSSRPSSFLHAGLYDNYTLVCDEEAFACCRALYRSTGIHLGGSGGAALYACIRHLQANPGVKDAVCLCADRGENYMSSIYSDTWLEQQALDLSLERLHVLQTAFEGMLCSG